MIIFESGILWRRVGKRFEDRISAAEKQGYTVKVMYSNQFDTEEGTFRRSLIQLRLVLVAVVIRQIPLKGSD